MPVRAFVVAGLLLSIVVNVLFVAAPADPLPGVALGSALLLVVERIVAMFAMWLAIGVVFAEAWRGRLPIEVSGRGVRYASAQGTEQAMEMLNAGLLRHEVWIQGLERQLGDLGDRGRRQTGR